MMRPFAPFASAFQRLYLVLTLGMLLFSAPCSAQSLLLLGGGSNSGSHAFARTFTEVWERPGFSDQSLSWGTEPDPRLRLQRLTHRQGDLAVVDARTAHEVLPDHPLLCAVSVLWPNQMVLLTVPAPSGGIQELLLPPSATPYLTAWAGLSSGLPRVQVLQEQPEALQPGQTLVWLGLPQTLRTLVFQDASIQIQVLSASIQQALQQGNPWLRSGTLPAGALPRQSRAVPTLEQRSVLVARCDLSDRRVTEVLDGLFRMATWPHPPERFAGITAAANRDYLTTYPYHAAAQARFR